jgi:hypothetical protein
MTEVRGQRTEVRRQKTEDRRQRSEDRGQKIERWFQVSALPRAAEAASLSEKETTFL